MIRWVFVFEEGNAKSDVIDDVEDARIADFIASNPCGMLLLPGEVTTYYVNLARVKAVARTVMTDEQVAIEAAQAQAAALAAQPAVVPAEVIPA